MKSRMMWCWRVPCLAAAVWFLGLAVMFAGEEAARGLEEPGLIEIETKILEVDTTVFQDNKALFDKAAQGFSQEEFVNFVRSINQLKGVDMVSAPKVTVKDKKTAFIKIVISGTGKRTDLLG